MCTVVVLIHPSHVMLAANRDERIDRPWDPPAEYWPGILGGRDRTAGGTWMALNRHGLMAAVLNRPGTLGPTAGKRSRGELPLIALRDAATAAEAADMLATLDAGEWRGFNMVLADRSGAFFVKGPGHGHPQTMPLPQGVFMITAHDPNDLASPRTARHLPRFRSDLPTPDDWSPWRAILSDRSGDAAEQINVMPRGGFGTVCSSLVAWTGATPDWLFAAGAPDRTPFLPVTWTQA